MGQSGEQGQIIEVLRSSLLVFAEEQGWSSVLVASDNFFAWVDGEPHVQVSPDVYILDNPPAFDDPLPGRWETWRPEHRPPRFAVEIVSTKWKKDYDINPARYDHLGVGELVLADRDAFVRGLSGEKRTANKKAAKKRAPFLVYRRNEHDRLERVYRGNGPVHCAEIDAYLCFQHSSPGRPRVRISRDPKGVDIVPTEGEKIALAQAKVVAAKEAAAAAEKKVAAAEKKASNAEKKAADAQQKAADAEKTAAAQAEELAALRARLQAFESDS